MNFINYHSSDNLIIYSDSAATDKFLSVAHVKVWQ